MTPYPRRGRTAATRSFVLILAWLLAVPTFEGRQESAPSLILAGTVIDGTGSAPRTNVAIVIRDGRIVEVRSATPADAANPRAIDLTALHVLPGLMDVHAHVTMSHDPDLDYGELSAPTTGILGVVHARRTLMAGFTTVRDPFGPYYADVALRDAIAAGWIDGPRMFVSGPALTMTGGHGAVGNWAPPELELRTTAVTIADGTDEIRRAVRLHQKRGVDFIKIVATGGIFTDRSDPGAASYTSDELEAAVDEARKRGQRVAAHAHGLEGIRNAVLAGVHSIEHGSYLDTATAALMAERGVFLVPDVYADEYTLMHGEALGLDPAHMVKARTVSGHFRQSFRLAHAAGVKIAFGTDAGVFPHGENAKQFALYVKLGMTPMEAMLSATRNAAELIGVKDDLGTIETGRRADLIAVASSPLQDIRQLEAVVFVMKDGVVVKNETARRP